MKSWLLLALSVLNISWNDANDSDNSLPCEFYDSIDISAGIRHSNESITYNEMEFTPDNYGIVDYRFVNGAERVTVQPYHRGCPCGIRKCTRLCCPYGSALIGLKYIENTLQLSCENHDSAKNPQIVVFDQNTHAKTHRLEEDYVLLERPTCKQHYTAAGNFKFTDVSIFFIRFHCDYLKLHLLLTEWRTFIRR